MKKSMKLIPTILFFFLVSCNQAIAVNLHTITETAIPRTNTPQPTSTPFFPVIQETEKPRQQTKTTVELTPTATPDPFPNVYGCEMEIKFLSGPLEDKDTVFSVLGEDYFIDKGDKFAVGKGTGVFYEAQRYFIMHSSYVRGNVLRPMEAEFLRKYLENWGGVGSEYIQEKIDQLIGSKVNWICNDEFVFSTEINEIVRLSHEASDRLWLEPQQLEKILIDREGLVSEWVGEINDQGDENFYLGFCGWGPNSLENGRYTYYRYLISFTPID